MADIECRSSTQTLFT